MRWGRMVGATLLTLCVLGCAANPRIAEPSVPLPGNAAGADSEATDVEAATRPARASRRKACCFMGVTSFTCRPRPTGP